MNKIIVFANQKGGVGKTTLSILFANYLTRLKKQVMFLDADHQHSASAVRQEDENFQSSSAPYTLHEISLRDAKQVEIVINKAKKFDGTVVIDCPGSIADAGIGVIFSHADIVVIPFEFDDIGLKATTDFIRVINHIKIKYGYGCQLLIVPSKVQLSFGTASDLAAWKTALNSYTIAGKVLPKVVHRAQLKRINTYTVTPAQLEVVRDTFDRIIKESNI